MSLSVSVIIPAYNYVRFVGRAIDSALAQTYSEVDVTVVDDGSTDGTAALLSRYGDEITVINQPNLGVSAARNAGASVSTGSLLAFLDADDHWDSRKIALQVERYTEQPHVGLVHCGVQDIDEEGDPLGEPRAGMSGYVTEEMLLLRRTVILAAPSNALVPRSVFEEVGGFDTALSTAADWDLCFRISTRYAFSFLPEPLVYYTLHSTNMHRNVGVMDCDMHLAFRKAFSARTETTVGHLRRKSYASLYMTLSGSYFSAGQSLRALKAGATCCLFEPRMAPRLARSLVRRVASRSG